MTEAERQIESRDEQKERIRKKYKGINADELDVILAKPPDSLYEESKERRVAVYARVSTGDPRQTSSYRQKNHHEAIISRDDFIAVQKMIANAKYGNKGILPELHVIATGALRGFVSVHPRWAGFSVKDYHKASESVYDPQLRLPDEPQNIVVDEGSFDLRGYEIARSQFITSQNQLTCTMGIQELKFGIHGIRKMDNVEYVELLIHPTEKALAVRKSTKANKYAIWWAQPKDGVIVPRKIAATSFMKTIFEMLGWRDDCRYRVRGVRKQDENETVLVFDLQDTEVFLPHQTPPSTDEEMEGNDLIVLGTGYRVLLGIQHIACGGYGFPNKVGGLIADTVRVDDSSGECQITVRIGGAGFQHLDSTVREPFTQLEGTHQGCFTACFLLMKGDKCRP